MSKASTMLWGLGQAREAVEFYDQCIEIRETLVVRGRSDLRGDVALAQALRGMALLKQGRPIEALQAFGPAIEALREEVNRTHRPDLQDFLSFTEQTTQDSP